MEKTLEKTEIAETFQYLAFQLGDEEYGIEVQSIREILELQSIGITRVPQTQAFMLGVMNVRGSVVPVTDLRVKLGRDATERTVDTAIIVLELTIGGEEVLIGVLVDSVDEVLELRPESVAEVPKVGLGIDSDLLKGMGKRGEAFVQLLDIYRLFSPDEMHEVREASVELERSGA